MKATLKLLCYFALAVILAACGQEVRIPANSVCYWQPELILSDAEITFMNQQRVQVVYLHIFDLDVDSAGNLVCANTIKPKDHFPKSVTVVPMVRLCSGVLSTDTLLPKAADAIVAGASEFMAKNGYDFHGIQIDYDWTKTQQNVYFNLLKKVKKNMRKVENGQVSACVWLHHLATTPPPVDYAVLMLYRRGGKADTINGQTLFKKSVIRKHLQLLKKYDIPMATVLPFCGYNLVYDSVGQFRYIVRNLNLADSTSFEKIGKDEYRVCSREYLQLSAGHSMADCPVYPGDIVRHFQPSAGLLDTIASAISRVRPHDSGNIVMYQLNPQCVAAYTPAQFKQIFLGGSLVHADSFHW